MGRLILLVLVIVTIIVLWKAFVSTPKRGVGGGNTERPAAPKGPDDDPDFLWKLDKARYEERKAQRERQQREQQGPSKGTEKGTEHETKGKNDRSEQSDSDDQPGADSTEA